MEAKRLDVHYEFGGLRFVWNAQREADNYGKHKVRIETASEVFLDPLSRLADASVEGETREALLGEREPTSYSLECTWIGLET